MHLLSILFVAALLMVTPLFPKNKTAGVAADNPLFTLISQDDLQANETWIKYENGVLSIYPKPSLGKIFAKGAVAAIFLLGGVTFLVGTESSKQPTPNKKIGDFFCGMVGLGLGTACMYSAQSDWELRQDQSEPMLELDTLGIRAIGDQKILWKDVTSYTWEKKEFNHITSKKIKLRSENASVSIECDNLPIRFKVFKKLIGFYLNLVG